MVDLERLGKYPRAPYNKLLAEQATNKGVIVRAAIASDPLFPPLGVLALQYKVCVTTAERWISDREIPMANQLALQALPTVPALWIAELFRCNRRTVVGWPYTKLPFYREGRWRRYPREAALAYFGGIEQDLNNLLDCNEVAKRTGIPYEMVTYDIRSGKLPAFTRPSGTYLVPFGSMQLYPDGC